MWRRAEGFIDGRASKNQKKKEETASCISEGSRSLWPTAQKLKLLPRVSLKYFLRASIKKEVAPSESERLIQKLCKSDERYWNYKDFYKSEPYGPLRNALTEEIIFGLETFFQTNEMFYQSTCFGFEQNSRS